MSTEQRAGDRLALEEGVQEFMQPVRKSIFSEARVAYPVAVTPRGHSRRRAERVNLVSTDVVVMIDHENVSVVDLSVGGIQFRTNNRLVPGSTVMLRIHWRDDGRRSVALGRVMWATFERPAKFSHPHYRVGAFFEQSDIPTFRRVVQRYGLAATSSDFEIVDPHW